MNAHERLESSSSSLRVTSYRQLITAFLCRSVALVALAGLPARSAHADVTCGGTLSDGEGATISATGTLHALLIFARFPDGMDMDDATHAISECSGCGPGWPAGTETRPAWADSLLEEFGGTGEPSAPQLPGSLSHFFYKMSQGQHRLKGHAVSQVVVAPYNVYDYASSGGLYAANRDILQQAHDLGLVNYADFDLGGPAGVPDDVVDYVFIIWQSTATVHNGQFYNLNGGYSAYSSLVPDDQLVLDGKRLKVQGGAWISQIRQASGEFLQYPFLVRHRWMVAAVAAHEYGHDLLGASHNGDGAHITTESRYGIMQGSMTPPIMMMSGYMRYKLGWIHPHEVVIPSQFPFDSTLALSADYENGDGCFAIVRTAITQPHAQYFILEARRPNMTGRPYNASTLPNASCCYPTRDVGEGLLITHIREDGCRDLTCAPAPPLLEVEVATGRFDTTSVRPDPTTGLTRLEWDTFHALDQPDWPHGGRRGPATGRAGDLFRPRGTASALYANAFTPFTNPSTYLYDESHYGSYPRSVFSGTSIYDIQWNAAQDSMTMKVRIENPAATPVQSDTLRTNMTLDGLMQLTGDLVVQPNKTLTLKEGSAVVAGEHATRLKGGADLNLVELIGRGRVDAEGTSTNGVSLLSSRSASFWDQDSLFDWIPNWHKGQSQPAGGDWYGVRFLDSPGAAISDLNYAHFEYPKIAVTIDSLSGNLFHPSFTGVGQYRIYLEESTRIVEGHTWSLDAPDTVVIRSQNPLLDYFPVKMTVDGALWTQDPLSSGKRVLITSSNPDSLLGNDWLGIVIRGDGWNGDGLGVGVIRDAEIAFASYPLTFLGADSAFVGNSWFHHYHDEAITDFASDATIKGNLIWRGARMADLPDVVGRVGIHLGTSFGICDSNQVFHQMQKGIWADFVSGYCSAPTQLPPRRALAIENNDVIGDRSGPFGNLDANGIEVSWACREQDVGVHDNNVQNWPSIGIKVRQSSDVWISCNCVMGNGIGVWHRRDKLDYSTPYADGYSLLVNNLLKQNVSYNMTTAEQGPRYEPNGAITAGIYGGGYTGSGGNILQLLQNAKNWRMDSIQHRTDVAQANWWEAADGTVFATESLINANNEWPHYQDQTIDVSNFHSTTALLSCQEAWLSGCPVPSPPGGGGQAAALARGESTGGAPDDHRPAESSSGASTSAMEITDLPMVLALHPPRPNPTRDGVLMQLEVPEGDAGHLEIRVYDVTGRRVRTLLSGEAAPGRREVAWDLRDVAGKRVSAGIYFARMELGETRVVHRIVVLK